MGTLNLLNQNELSTALVTPSVSYYSKESRTVCLLFIFHNFFGFGQ